MRTPRADLLPASERVQVLPLDVTDAASIHAAVDGAGPVDALVNNAGVGLLGVFEGTPMAAVRGTFETNLFGAMAVTQAFLPQFRHRKTGVIVNVSSSTTLLPLPMVAAYTASKAAINAFTESLALELEPFNVRVRLRIPGNRVRRRSPGMRRRRCRSGASLFRRPTPTSPGSCSSGCPGTPDRPPGRSTSPR